MASSMLAECKLEVAMDTDRSKRSVLFLRCPEESARAAGSCGQAKPPKPQTARLCIGFRNPWSRQRPMRPLR